MANEAKLKSVVAYLAERTSPGKLKLFKLMYLADFTAFAEIGRSITGDTYESWEMGPVPVTLWHGIKRGMLSDCVRIDLVETAGLPEQQFSARRDFTPDLTAEERAVLDRIVSRHGDWTGNQLKAYTHKTIPFRATEPGDSIKYGLAAYLRYQKPTQRDVDRLLSDREFVAELREALSA